MRKSDKEKWKKTKENKQQQTGNEKKDVSTNTE